MKVEAAPQTLDAAGIAARVPHQGAMALLARLHAWDEQTLHAQAKPLDDPAHPLRSASGVLAPAAIELAAQAMALHAGLRASIGASDGAAPAVQGGFLASARNVVMHQAELSDCPQPMQVRVQRQTGDARQAIYQFKLLCAAGQLVVEGRVAVVLAGIPSESPA